LGSMNDFGWHYQLMAEDAKSKVDLSLSKTEFTLSQMPSKPIDYKSPSEIVIGLLTP
jgi:hypothetical protein